MQHTTHIKHAPTLPHPLPPHLQVNTFSAATGQEAWPAMTTTTLLGSSAKTSFQIRDMFLVLSAM